VVPTLAARLRAAPWGDVVTGMIGDDSGADGVNTPLSLLYRQDGTRALAVTGHLDTAPECMYSPDFCARLEQRHLTRG